MAQNFEFTGDITDFSIKFGGTPGTVNASTYGVVLVNTVALFKEANAQLKTNVPIEINVKSETEGSFLAQIGLEPSALHGLLNSHGLATVPVVFNLVMQAFKFRKELKEVFGDSKPTGVSVDGEIYKVNGIGNVNLNVNKTTYNYFQLPKAQKAMKEIFSALDEDPEVSDFSFLDEKGESLFTAERKEFSKLKSPPELPTEESRIEPDTATVYIIKPSFDPDLVWEVVYRGEKKSVYVRDADFLQRMVQREFLFGPGDSLESELEVEQRYDPRLGVYVNTGKVDITRVVNVIPKSEPPPLFESE